jgi:gliding-associated putative ABC transporter substrate-binding component GldG
MSRNALSGTSAALLVLAIVVLVNVVSVGYFGRLDLTEGRIFSLNDASKRLVGDLQDDFLVKAYFSKDLPSPYNANAKYVQDLLQEYKAYGKRHFRFEFVDPGDDTELEREAQQHRIPPVQVQVVERDQFQSRKAYMGLVFLYKDKQETIPVVENLMGLEYEITATIKKLTSERETLPVIGFLSGHQGPDLSQLQIVQQVLAKQYQMLMVDASDSSMIEPSDVDVLIIASPRSSFSEWEKFVIDQYLMKGGRIAFLIDKVNADLQTQRAMPIALQMDDWFRNYGFHVNDDLVADLQNTGMLTIQQQEGFFTMMSQKPYPLIPSLRDFDRSNTMVKDLERLSLFYVSSIDTSAASQQGLRAEVLLRSSEASMVQRGNYNISPTQAWNPETFDQGPFAVVAVVSGEFPSWFKGKPVPSVNDSTVADPDLQPLEQSMETRIVVVGDGEFFVDQKGGNDRDNFQFFQNMVDWLVQDEDLIAIRSRDVTDRPLQPVSEPTKRLIKYGNILGSPLLVILVGVGLWQARRRRTIEL